MCVCVCELCMYIGKVLHVNAIKTGREKTCDIFGDKIDSNKKKKHS